jgi:hypothetical protein
VTGDGAPVTLSEKLELIADHWHPRIVARVDGYRVKLVKVKGEFVWHAHATRTRCSSSSKATS